MIASPSETSIYLGAGHTSSIYVVNASVSDLFLMNDFLVYYEEQSTNAI